jgi:hypothetical protein
VVILSLNLLCWRLSLAKIPLGVGVVGDEVEVEGETRDLDPYFDWVDKPGEQNNLSTRLLLGVIAVNCMVVGQDGELGYEDYGVNGAPPRLPTYGLH